MIIDKKIQKKRGIEYKYHKFYTGPEENSKMCVISDSLGESTEHNYNKTYMYI